MEKEIIRTNNLFERVLVILEEARTNVIRTINNNMVIAYWLIGREIVEEMQSGAKRAEYGKQVIEELSRNLQEKFVRGYSITNLRYFRTFFTVYQNRTPEIRHIRGGELVAKQHLGSGVFEHLTSSMATSTEVKGFSPNLSWSHYRELMKIENNSERLFYEIEAEAEFWEVSLLKRQIHSFLFARLLKSKDKAGVFELTKKGQNISESIDLIKNPYILDFLGIPEVNQFHESDIEKAIINHIQSFLIELGKGFAFVGRQKRMQFDDEYYYIDLVFYNCILKCYLLIDLKMGTLKHQDIGQMDSYVRMFDDKFLTEGDNPTIGLILCAETNSTIAKYSVLNENKNLFASKYMLYLPTEQEFARELEKERKIIESDISEREK